MVAARTYDPSVQTMQTCGWDEDSDTHVGSKILEDENPTGVLG
jgi:hypothetical protein